MCLELEEVVRLLKSKGIRLHRDQSAAGAEDYAKRKLYASYLKKKKHQTERHVLRKEMAEHAIPRLFVSQRSDKNPNGFNCAICRKDISFLSKGEPEIWRHFGSKTHFLRDRRYRLDHEDYVYTSRFDAVEVSSISAELRAEIEKTPAVVLGCKNSFVEDEVDALVGVASNVPASTLVGGLFELLRSGGSHSFLRRLWNQFRTTMPVDSDCAHSTWSKTESLVVLTQTLYPRIIRRVQSWCKDAHFSVSFREDCDGLRCFVHCWNAGSLHEVCVLWEPLRPGICDAEIACLSRLLAVLPDGTTPVSLRGCSSTLFNVFSDWCKADNRPVPLLMMEYSVEMFKEHVREASGPSSGSLDPFSIVEYLLLRLGKASHQPWLMGMCELRRCVQRNVVPFASLCTVLDELICNWGDVQSFLKESSVVPASRSRTPADLNQMVLSDAQVLPRLSLLHLLVSCFQANFQKLSAQDICDYSCRSYGEFCFFYWSVLSKVKKLSDLPDIDSWSEYIGRPLNTWPNVAYVDCFRGERIFGIAMTGFTDSRRRSFLRDCHGLLMEFLKVLARCPFVHSQLASNLSCFAPDMLLLGDENYTVELFRGLMACFQDCGRVTNVVAEGACNEFKSFLVDLRRRNRRVVSTITDTFVFMQQAEAFGCRGNLSHVVQLASLVAIPREVRYPDVEFSLSGVRVPKNILLSSIFAVQSFISAPGFNSGELLTKDCLLELKANLPVGKDFLNNESFAPWQPLYVLNRQDLYRGLRDRFDEYYLGQVAEWRRRAGQPPLTGLSSSTSMSVAAASPQTSVELGVVADPSVSPLSVGVSAAVAVAGSSTESAVSPQASPLFAALSYSPTSSRDVTRMLRQKREARRASQESGSEGKDSTPVKKR